MNYKAVTAPTSANTGSNIGHDLKWIYLPSEKEQLEIIMDAEAILRESVETAAHEAKVSHLVGLQKSYQTCDLEPVGADAPNYKRVGLFSELIFRALIDHELKALT